MKLDGEESFTSQIAVKQLFTKICCFPPFSCCYFL